MKYTDNTINILTTRTFKGIGNAWVVNNLQGNENVEKIVSLLNTKSKQTEEISLDYFKYKKIKLLRLLMLLEIVVMVL